MQWNYLACPVENECLNGHHTCQSEVETCVDQIIGECNYLISNCEHAYVSDDFMISTLRMSRLSHLLFIIINGYHKGGAILMAMLLKLTHKSA